MSLYSRGILPLVLFFCLMVIARAQLTPIPPTYPQGTLYSSQDLSVPIIELLRGYGFRHVERGFNHELSWEEGEKRVVVRFMIDHSMIDLVMQRIKSPRIGVEIEASSGEKSLHFAQYFLDFSKIEEVNQLFQILKSEGAMPPIAGGAHRVLLNRVNHWSSRAQRILRENEFQVDGRKFSFVHEANGLASRMRSYETQVHLYEYLMGEGVLCDLELLDHRGVRSRVLLLVNADTSFAVLETMIQTIHSRNKRQVIRDMNSLEQGDFYQRVSERFSIQRSKRVLSTIRETLLEINPTSREIPLAELHDAERVMLAEYLSRAFCERYGRSPTMENVLREIRESTHGVVTLKDVEMDKNIDLQIHIGEVLHELQWDVTHSDAPLRLKRVFMREIFRNIRRR